MRFATVNFEIWRQDIQADPTPFVAVLQRRPYPCVAKVLYQDRDDFELVILHDAGEYDQFMITCRQQTAPNVTKALVLIQSDPDANTVDIIVGGPPDPPGGPNMSVIVQRSPASGQPVAQARARQQPPSRSSLPCRCAADQMGLAPEVIDRASPAG